MTALAAILAAAITGVLGLVVGYRMRTWQEPHYVLAAEFVDSRFVESEDGMEPWRDPYTEGLVR